MQSKYTQIVSQKNTLCEENVKLKAENKDMSKKLFRMVADEDIITLDPYEMHKKTRYLESKLEFL